MYLGKLFVIWDTLGIYDAIARVIVIDDEKILEHSNKISDKIEIETGVNKERIGYIILRELVRLHEHAHAFLHVSGIEALRSHGAGSLSNDHW